MSLKPCLFCYRKLFSPQVSVLFSISLQQRMNLLSLQVVNYIQTSPIPWNSQLVLSTFLKHLSQQKSYRSAPTNHAIHFLRLFLDCINCRDEKYWSSFLQYSPKSPKFIGQLKVFKKNINPHWIVVNLYKNTAKMLLICTPIVWNLYFKSLTSHIARLYNNEIILVLISIASCCL